MAKRSPDSMNVILRAEVVLLRASYSWRPTSLRAAGVSYGVSIAARHSDHLDNCDAA